ncbi:Glyoxylase, beta-lactamase superfamily II [Marinobacter gudaonensis]|uniref:Glyoxylase, beta-lactamase superfamily II n=1 Tax=Marinobacter gudaonensis TaxID=375760 RepID=A0A1I6HVU8_9GAMM|nr:MBL fold metallo-hydrolase [Marinobacter gudaonensis]SFR58571.1 Glyoxylase, beta-lactamase superfamily II [Marinobacter gudaonensis]
MSLKYRVIPVTPFEQNCTLLWCTETMKAAVVDPGGNLERIRAAVKEEGVTLEKILLTHAHIDHAGGTAELAKASGLPIEGPHREDDFWIQGLAMQAQMFGFPAPEIFTPSRWLEDGDTVTVGNEVLEVLHCPGHTPGHVVFFHRASKLAQVGDVLFNGSIGRTDFPRGDYNTLIRSIREKLFALGDDVQFICGHGPMSTFGRERQTNPFVSDHRG